ncbi:CusA/CzcA family heavy metal efflux RND transporter [bacterium TMED277]|mgnify:CR=1 FL=1|jgi:heavy metal efflux system protein|nr:efflux RND transporter permease subunit [Planctomycetaceae bacterium]MBT7729249.1 efflux RND transporter permease subunit [Planctomycetaceae bacterium]OUX44101.1 MAG: CusA/CzcA family heavy metal efflux RND transporter [bacterium TMED277]
MLNWIIDASLRHRFAVIASVVVVALAGVVSLQYLDIDAFPDTTPVQVQVNTTAPALLPEEVERQITFPIEQAISGLPGLDQLRSVSKFGFSQVTVVFDDSTDIYFARQLINERLGTVELPAGIERPEMGPVSSGLGEVFHYVLTYDGYDFSTLDQQERINKLTELRTLHDWTIKPQLRTVSGTAEVNSWGGYEKQYQVRVDPDRLIRHGLTFDEVIEALQQNNRSVGGGNIVRSGEMLLVHGQGRTTTLGQIADIVIKSVDGIPIRIGQVADVEIGYEIRRGAVTADGKGEAVMGLGFCLMGENTHEVTEGLKAKLDSIRSNLPPGVRIVSMYDRTELVDQVLETVRKNLFEGGLFVIAVLFVFLGNLRAGLIVALAIPLSMLCAFSGMVRFGISASLLSLGAIDFGLVVDSSVVMIENCTRHLSLNRAGKNKLELIRDAAIEVRKPTLFGELIIMIVYLPILTLEGIEGKLFRPMALTVVFALAGSMLLSLTLMPVLASLLLPKQMKEREPLPVRVAKWIYLPILHFTMRHKLAVIGFALCVLVVSFGMIAPNLGTEFVPQLSEGAVAINVVRLAGTSLEESIRYNTQMERAVLENFPDEVAHVWSRIGTAEIATDPMGVELTDLFITLRPRQSWKKATTQTGLMAAIEKTLRDLPGQRLAFTQPIKLRMDEIATGVRSDVAVKLFGDDFDQLVDTAQSIERVLTQVDGSADVSADQITGQPVLQIQVKQDEIARYGISASSVLDIVESIGSLNVGEVYEDQLRFPLVVRLPESKRTDPETIGNILIMTPAGEQIPLSRLATIKTAEGPSQIAREWAQRRINISANVRGRDLGGFVADAQRQIAEQVDLPEGRYHIEWGGQFEHMQRARSRLMLVVPVALCLVFALLYMTYNNVIDTVRVFTGIPFAWTGGIFALWIRDMPFSISAAIGFIALSGVAVLDDMLLVSTIRQLRSRGAALEAAVERAAMTRLRPVLMTSLVASLGFLPMAFSTGMGAEVQRPLATVVIGGVISATVMSLLVLRVLYIVFKGPTDNKQPHPEMITESLDEPITV